MSYRSSDDPANRPPQTQLMFRSFFFSFNLIFPWSRYTGGSSSGMMVQDSGKPKSAVDDLIEKAKHAGAGRTQADHEKEKAAKAKQPFAGGGYSLGDGVNPSKPVAKPAPAADEDESAKNLDIYFYKDGFTVTKEGPFRRLDDPLNKAFLDSINRGQVPRELGNRDLEITLHDHRKDNYVPPPKPVEKFAGSGHRLGSTFSDTPAAASGAGQRPAAAPAAAAASTAPANPQASSGADESKETTSIQLRLHDGTRLVAKFNLTQTVGDIRRFVNAARPEMGGILYDLMTTFPRKILENDKETIADAGLKGATVVQAKK